MRFHHSKNPSRIALGVLTVGALVVLSSCASSTPEPEESAAGVDFPVATGSGSPTVLDDAEWESLVEAANAEGELIVYSSPPGTEETFAQFSEDYPDITVTVVREPTSDLIARMDQEIDAGVAGADVTWHSQPAWAATRAEDGALNALQLSPEAAELGWGEFATDDYYLQIMANPYLLGWNTTLGEPVDNIQDLLAKAGDTPVGIAEPISQNGMFQLQTWMDEYGEDFLGELAALNHTVIRSTTPLAQSLAAGEVGYAILMQPGLLDQLKEEGAPVEQIVPDDGLVTGFAYGPMTLAGADHPAAAQVFVNWLMSQPTQQLLVDSHGPLAVPIILDGTENALAWDEVQAVDDAEWPQERRDEFRAVWDSYFLP
ncbi:ABC transporter substrate-binding protein [Microbacterium invictum]|uniref:Iron(III) transport system substrate-binding protein n=1 Tax=Microbacterium invictum TaxID=515415 RepID=A0AA40SS66_9MICO|nr:extracellular solute-binding protein [Microbacterium invictum]MBB4141281.1 iron(III) transport system substrate-binding protein [Microbacterium invictum]